MFMTSSPRGGGGVLGLQIDRGVPPTFSKMTPFLGKENERNDTHFYGISIGIGTEKVKIIVLSDFFGLEIPLLQKNILNDTHF